jgi:hypothetical protein
VNLSIKEGAIKRILNKEADWARKQMDREGRDARVVSDVWVVMEAELAETFSTAASVSAKAEGTDITVKASGGVGGSSTVKLSEGTTFAYALMKVRKWKNGKIQDMEKDYKGMG